MSNKKVYKIILEGKDIVDIPSFYTQINAQLMQGEDWSLGESLDAFNDLLYGGFGAAKDADLLEIEWHDIDISRKHLGIETTKAYYQAKIQHGKPYNTALFQEKLQALAQGRGPTYFDILIEIIQSHRDRVRLI